MRPDQFQAAVGAASQASTGGACDDPPLVIAQNYIPPQSTEQPQMQLLPVLQKHVPVISTSQSSLPVTHLFHIVISILGALQCNNQVQMF